MISITAAEFQRKFGQYQDAALVEPVSISKHGRESVVLISAEEFRFLKQRAREVLHVSEYTDDEISLLEETHMSEKHNHLNAELDK